MKKAYRCRIYPNKTQIKLLHQTFGCTRFVYNQLLDATKLMHQAKIQGRWKHPSKIDVVKAVKSLKEDRDYAFLKEVDSIALQSAAENVADAFDRWFRKQNKFPTFKKRSHKNSYTTKTTNNNIRFVANNRLKVPKIGTVKIKDSFGLQGKAIRRITITKETNGQYYVSLLVEETIQPLQKTNATIGLDMGLTHFLAGSDGSFVKTPSFFIKYEQQLTKAQRTLSRRIEQAKKENRSLRDSRNVQKARQRVATIHAKIKHCRRDFLHKLTKQLVTDYDVLAIEQLQVTKLLQTGRLAKQIADVSWSMFATYLQYKAVWYEKQVILVNPAYTSQTCRMCQQVDATSRKGAIFCCTNCGYTEQADTHAAKNIQRMAGC